MQINKHPWVQKVLADKRGKPWPLGNHSRRFDSGMLQTYHTKQWIHNAYSRWAPPALIYLKVEHKWKTANSTQHLHAGHVSLDIKRNESHTSPVWTGWKWCSSNEPASQLNVFTLHTPLWRRWCERLQVSSAGEDCQRRRGAAVLGVGVGERNGNGATAHWGHQPATVRTGNMTH